MDQSDLFGMDGLADVIVAGVDEAGRGPLAGAVYAAAVILDPARPIDGLADSKVLTAERRDELAVLIRENALAWFIAKSSVREIDKLNILRATMLAMQRAVAGLPVKPGLALVDGNQAPKLKCGVKTIIKGDALVPAISAASILAKTARDADLVRLHGKYPHYGFDQHKGYGTAMHLERLREHGPCPEHRQSFAPVKAWVAGTVETLVVETTLTTITTVTTMPLVAD
ncbi:ribonuclease HII [Bordetella genomosp. 10]|uniref:Ribonuclease HII n=1 Tax=Bordetella genomosp. 10 TaxID=1416804 RepID=A0A261SCT8_9BORD|nr:ribonuclease HII [Bordetella genomosp. 10]